MMRRILGLLKNNLVLVIITGVVGVGMASVPSHAEWSHAILTDRDVQTVQKVGRSNIITEAREECRQDIKGQTRKLKDDYAHLGGERDERYVKCMRKQRANNHQSCSDKTDSWRRGEEIRIENEFRQLKEKLKGCES